MKKFIYVLMVCLFGVITQTGEICAYELPNDEQNVNYLRVVESELGEITIYFATNSEEVLSLDKSTCQLLNVSSGTVYGYFDYGGTVYRVTCSSFTVPTYRLESNYNTYDLSIESIVDTNMTFINDVSSLLVNDYNFNLYSLGSLVVVGGLLCLIYLKH